MKLDNDKVTVAFSFYNPEHANGLVRICHGQLAKGMYKGKEEPCIICSEANFRKAMHNAVFRECLSKEESICIYYPHPRGKFMMLGLRPVPRFTYAFTKFMGNEDNDALLYTEPMSWEDAVRRFADKGCMWYNGVASTANHLRMTGEQEVSPACEQISVICGSTNPALLHYCGMALAAAAANIERTRFAKNLNTRRQ